MKDMLRRAVCGVLLFSIGIALTSHLVFGKKHSILEEPFPAEKVEEMLNRSGRAENGRFVLRGCNKITFTFFFIIGTYFVF